MAFIFVLLFQLHVINIPPYSLRWKQLQNNFKKKGVFDCSKIPDIYDCAKYDLTHNSHLNLPALTPVFCTSRALARIVIPGEYGVNPYQKLQIGRQICGNLLGKLIHDLRMIQAESHKPGHSTDPPSPTATPAGTEAHAGGFGGGSGETGKEPGGDRSSVD